MKGIWCHSPPSPALRLPAHAEPQVTIGRGRARGEVPDSERYCGDDAHLTGLKRRPQCARKVGRWVLYEPPPAAEALDILHERGWWLSGSSQARLQPFLDRRLSKRFVSHIREVVQEGRVRHYCQLLLRTREYPLERRRASRLDGIDSLDD
eukprot:scaffold114245_cov35-Tisochrysis_lutea.AAC.1